MWFDLWLHDWLYICKQKTHVSILSLWTCALLQRSPSIKQWTHENQILYDTEKHKPCYWAVLLERWKKRVWFPRLRYDESNLSTHLANHLLIDANLLKAKQLSCHELCCHYFTNHVLYFGRQGTITLWYTGPLRPLNWFHMNGQLNLYYYSGCCSKHIKCRLLYFTAASPQVRTPLRRAKRITSVWPEAARQQSLAGSRWLVFKGKTKPPNKRQAKPSTRRVGSSELEPSGRLRYQPVSIISSITRSLCSCDANMFHPPGVGCRAALLWTFLARNAHRSLRKKKTNRCSVCF